MAERESVRGSRQRDSFDWISLDDYSENVTPPGSTDPAHDVPQFDSHEDVVRSPVSGVNSANSQINASTDARENEDGLPSDENCQTPYSPLLVDAMRREGETLSQHDSASVPHPGNASDETHCLQTPRMADAGDTWVDQPKWRPFYLRSTFLLGLAAVFALMIAALEILDYVSERDQGLATVSQNLHYLWTYGPTFGT